MQTRLKISLTKTGVYLSWTFYFKRWTLKWTESLIPFLIQLVEASDFLLVRIVIGDKTFSIPNVAELYTFCSKLFEFAGEFLNFLECFVTTAFHAFGPVFFNNVPFEDDKMSSLKRKMRANDTQLCLLLQIYLSFVYSVAYFSPYFQ